jgi:hypothetical protein
MFTAITFMPYRTWFSFISSLESRGYAFSVGLLEHFNDYRVYTLFVGHLYSFIVRY